MDRTAAVTRIKRGLGFRSDLDDTIVDALKEAQRLLERGRTLPYFLMQEDQSLSVTSGSAEISLPTGFLKEVDDQGPHYINTDDKIVFTEKLDFDVGTLRFQSVDAGAPLAYALRKSTLVFWPSRDTAYTLTWSYYKSATALTTDVENEWLEESRGCPEALIGRAGMILAEDLENATAYTKFSKMYAEAWQGLLGATVERQLANKPLHMGGKL